MTFRFAEPWSLALLAPVALAGWLQFRAQRTGAARLAAFGEPNLIARMLPGGMPRGAVVAGIFGLVLAVVAAAGPQWGTPEAMPVRTGRDVMLVLDLSRSMFAEQPSRLEQAKRALRMLADRWEKQGDHRVGLTVFAGKAKLIFPLTADRDHLRFVLDQIEPDALPWNLGGDEGDAAPSGTRIGAGIETALEALDPRRRGWQDVVLLSDGDDPAGDDEWLQGARRAGERGVPIHVVALGDAAEGHPIPYRGKLLEWQGVPVRSLRNDVVLRDIARLAGGVFIPGTPGGVPLGRLLEEVWSERPPPPDALSRHPLPPTRRTGFIVAAIVCLAWWSTQRRRGIAVRTGRSAAAPQRSLFRPAFAAAVVLSVAASADDPAAAALRQARALFAQGAYAEALDLFDFSEAATFDPGQTALNGAVCAYKLGRFDDAAQRCLRAVDDQAASPERRARAWFVRGNALISASLGAKRTTLESAMEAYRQCLRSASDADLIRDARHNLDLAAALWERAPAESPQDPLDPNAPDPKSGKKTTPEGTDNGKKTDSKGNETSDAKSGGNDPASSDPAKKTAPGPLRVLPEQDRLEPLPLAETGEHLRQMAERIARERRAFRETWNRFKGNAKDW